MKKAFFITLSTLLLLMLTGCQVIGGIFKAGMWTGFILVAAVIAVLLWILLKIRKRPQD
ncbi:hypothetical protein ORI89_02350 [Sphingobacterium sp. UT-1RO-CII-1]|uniref:hypothetical protein n=1 Tax=Sphingobacterium sp. UT-1RO-CII-1 TaxID=2995225 RepID=UPI00227BD943|nr:hypothetical protein [Sphingobacterium sp. UT-1RO-CII-1]MCY4778477.1 hypothetical protein [Sphingobacterium sp. UT-1RO-CII-1]